ncbi:MAG: Crp/Fnr family transcriptional regulator [Candidatus Saccharibacteria bacterium]|nr:Crp/Fnr family transcriptional regulator [Candidatus Saccharibacteria bacterium]
MIHHLQLLIDSAVKRRFSAGSTMLYQGEVPRSAIILISGVVRVYSISEAGDEQVVIFHANGEFFPTSWIFEKTVGALFFYEAFTDCEVALVPRAELLSFIYSDPETTRFVLNYFASNYTASLIRVNALEQPKARDKLVYTLYYLCQRYSKNNDGRNFVTIPMSLTHQTLASLVGLTRETTAVEMSRLKKQKVISYKQQRYQINLEKLLEIIGEDSFKDIVITD